jgi:UDP-N-acetylmuramoyl-tripeptide--D-alanyl-D-alanine ligase
MRAALELLAGLPGRRIAVLGEMRELGEATAVGHQEVGAAAAVVCDILVVVGDGAAGIADGAIAAGFDPSAVVRTADISGARSVVLDLAREGDVILVKASRAAELDRLVAHVQVDLAARAER